MHSLEDDSVLYRIQPLNESHGIFIVAKNKSNSLIRWKNTSMLTIECSR